jgi:GDP-4-dehydro-6-deoxy-D-mannose reductase
MKERLLVTGARGFLGQWTLRHWREAYPDIELWATDIDQQGHGVHEDKYVQTDLCQPESVDELVRVCEPAWVIHLAGLVGDAPLARHLSINVIGTENLFNALCEAQSSRGIIQASSASIYGLIRQDELPVTEEQPYRPVSSYALIKLAQDFLALSVYHRHKMPIIRGCIFNILGPGQPDHLVPMTFIKQLKTMKAGSSNTLNVGNTSSRRDFVDVRDIVKAFDLLLQHGKNGEIYNIGTGREVSIEELIRELIAFSGIEVNVQAAEDRVRTLDVPGVRADITRLAQTTGWTPEIGWRESLKDMWDDYAG